LVVEEYNHVILTTRCRAVRRFDPAGLDRLLSPERAIWLPPDKIVDMLSLDSGLRVLDFGAGPGFLTMPIARRLDPTGAVVAADVEPIMLRHLLQRANKAGVTNAWPVVCDNRRLPFDDATLDRALLSLVLHEVEEPRLLLTEVSRVLRLGGSMVVVEWHPWHTEHGPDVSDRLPVDQVSRWLDAVGLLAGPHVSLSPDCYLLVAAKPASSKSRC
jgi:ubiquinone/menaquinone biosynthesis C-methylase UbiE